MSSRSLRRNRRAAAAGALAATLGFAGLGLASAPAGATADFDLERLAGADRIETAVEISQDTFTSATTALIARADLYPDALAGNYLAGAEQGPILLSHTDHVPEETLAELDRLGVTDVTLLGGTSALSQAVQDELEAAGLTVGREAGTDRYKTAAEIATSQDAAGIGEVDGARTAILATGERFPDALTGGPLAYAGSHPILLTPTATLGADAAGALDALGIEHVIILGGTAAVSDAAETAVEAMGITTERLAGATRYSTATEIAEWAIANAGFSNTHVDVATGQNFPDALTGGPHAGENTAPIILANDGNTAEAEAFLESIAATVAEGHIFGGTAAVSAAVEAALEAAGQTAPASATSRPELVSAAIVGTTTAGQATPTNPAGTTVRYVFDEAIATTGGLGPVAGSFHVYEADADPLSGDAVVSASGTEVVVRFNAADTAAEAAVLTVATVDEGAVKQTDGAVNPIGDAAIGSSSGGGTTALPAGTTVAPDLVSVGNFRQAAAAGDTAIDFTFDEAARTTAAPDFDLIQLDGTVLETTEPATGDNAAGGGTVAGGNGTTTITVIYDGPLATTPLLTAADIARGVVAEGSVAEQTNNETAPATLDENELQAADVSNSGNTTDPDLVSVQLRPDTDTDGAGPDTDVDQALFTFDQVVTAADATDFFLYKVDGSKIGGTAASAVINPADGRQVLVSFGATGTDNAVGGNVVTGATTPANDPDEVGVANTATSGVQTPGATSAPDLTAVALSDQVNAFGSVTGVYATYTFDEVVAGITEADFVLYLADGTRVTPTAASCVVGPAAGTTDDNTVRCTFGPGGTPSTVTYAKAATLGAVDDGGAVDAAGDLSPEGAAFTTGGTGTPTA